MIRGFTSSNYFDIKRYANDIHGVNEAIESGKAKIGIVIPSDYAKLIHSGRQAEIQVVVDATDSLSASSAVAAAQTLGLLKSNEVMTQKFMRMGFKIPPQSVDMRIKLWYNPDFITSWYLVPGIMGLLLCISLITLMAMAIVRESEQGTLEQLLVTPMHAWELLFSKILPYIVIGYLQIIISLLIGMYIFKMPFLGSKFLFFLLTFYYVVANLSFGIMISTFSQNQLQALQLSVFILLPTVMLSGFIFPIEAMPAGFRYVGYCFPATFFIDMARQIILKGGGFEYVWKDVAALCVFIAVVFSASVVMFKKKFVP
jgi:ABC-2 type transport system permease protein